MPKRLTYNIISVILLTCVSSAVYCDDNSISNGYALIYFNNETEYPIRINGNDYDIGGSDDGQWAIKIPEGLYVLQGGTSDFEEASAFAIGDFREGKTYTLTYRIRRKARYGSKYCDGLACQKSYRFYPVLEIENGKSFRIIDDITKTKNIEISASHTYPYVKVDPLIIEKRGAWAYDKRKYEQAFNIFKYGTYTGNAYSAFMVGYMYYKGEFVAQNYLEAFNNFNKAADLGYSQSNFYLGILYYKGMGTQKNYKDAFDSFDKAAKEGSLDALSNLGMMYQKGQGVEKDLVMAYSVWSIANDRGSRVGEGKLKKLIKSNALSEKDIEKGNKFIDKLEGIYNEL